MFNPEIRELSLDEVDAVAAGAHSFDFTIFGIRFVAGVNSDGATYTCAFGSSSGSCTYTYP